MTAQQLLSYLSQAIYLALFVVAAVRLVRRPSLAAFDTFLFFSVIAVLLLASDAARIFGFEDHPALRVLTWVGVSALPLILLRLADDFRPQPSLVMIGASLTFVLVAALGVLAPQPWQPPVQLIPVGWVVVLGVYASWTFVRESRVTTGLTRRRVQAVAAGSFLLALVLLIAGVNVLVPAVREPLGIVSQAVGLALVMAYFVGFAPPALLQRGWQEPVLRRFLAETPELVQLTSVDDIVDRIQQRARALTGADGATIGLWDAGREKLVFRDASGGLRFQDPGEWIGGRAFQSQEVRFTSVAEKDAPEHAEEYRTANIHAIVAAPITAEDRRLGVLIVYAARSFVFTDDVVSTTKLVAEQAAMVIHSHQLAREAAEVRALAEVTRLKQDFLSVLAHDVRTPLTTVLINAELLERAIGDDPVSQRRVASLRSEASRLKLLVEEYLEVVQTEEGERELRLGRHDLAELVTQAVEAVANGRTRVRVVAGEPVPGMYDTARIYQLVQNLVSNALKYSEADKPVEVRVWAEGDLGRLSVSDRGMGIAEADLAHVFERFHRGSNTDDRRHAGLGLGLYICRLVAREHGGDITVSSRLGEGTTFNVTLKRAETVEERAPEPQAPTEPAAGMVEPMLDPSPEST